VSGPIVLAVDDNAATLYANRRLLLQAGFEVWEATTGHEALEKARQRPDVVVLDIKLPDMTGLEVCRRLKHDPATASIPVLHLTATYGAGQDQAAALEGGADAYLTHPLEPIVLVATIRALLRGRAAENRRARSRRGGRRPSTPSATGSCSSTRTPGSSAATRPWRACARPRRTSC
jgi:DNA-binding response OmpR family regulator